jgi:hypothetical protein
MKLSYESEDVHQQVIEISKLYPKLYELYMLVFTKLKSFEYTDLELHIREELARSANSKQIKYLPNENAFEYRIPPHCKSGVLRMLFQVEADYWTICIKKVWTKGTKSSSKKERR